jgi:hypothetical protein
VNAFLRLLRDHLADPETGWSMGSFGAVAEFHQDGGETAVVDEPEALTRATRRGAIRLEPRRMRDVVPLAYETLSPKPHRWSQALALCMPAAKAKRAERKVLTRLEPDGDAVCGADRSGILFDMGLDLPQCDFCIRTGDPKLLGPLRDGEGHSLFAEGNPALPAILAGHPHRVALTAVGRVEVYQKIGGPDTGGVSPAGPHTHLLPKLLRTRRTHSANVPVPQGLVPLGAMHPGNPAIGPAGEDRPFDEALFRGFQGLLARYGRPDLFAQKQRVAAALLGGCDVAPEPEDRFARAAYRLALRQHERLAETRGDEALLRTARAWRRAVERDAAAEEDDAPGH